MRDAMLGIVKNVVGAVAPTLGTALAGPLGGAAAGIIAKSLGCENNERDIVKAVQNATPDQLAKIKEAELEFEAQMKELDVDLFALETKDNQDARKHFSRDFTARFIAILMVLFFCSYIGMITIMPPEQNSMELINLVLGYLGGLVSAVISFYFGASHKQE